MTLHTPISYLLCLLCLCNSCVSKGAKNAPADATQAPSTPTFDVDSTRNNVAQQLAFGYRIPGTPAHRATADWLKSKLEGYGATLIKQSMVVTLYDGKQVAAENIIAQIAPQKEERVLLCAHWDSRPFADHDPNYALRKEPVAGANDGASGVAILLEVARQLQIKSPQVGVDILLFDAEDWGTPNDYAGTYDEKSWALGSQYWAQNPHYTGHKPRYGILLDMVGAAGATFPREGYSMQYASSIVDKVWKRAQALGHGGYFIDTQGGYILDDHLYVNQVGIPTIDIIHLDSESETGFYPGWHTTHDTFKQIDGATLHAVGTTLLSLLYQPL